MTDRLPGWPVMTLALLSAAAICGGLALTGGPLQGRMEKRDTQRRTDLFAIEQHLRCRAYETGSLTLALEETPACPATPRLADPYTNEPCQISQIDAQNIRLCAAFEAKPEDIQTPHSLPYGIWKGGCVVVRIEPETPAR